jgi:maltose/moltooligosaccharide transporter
MLKYKKLLPLFLVQFFTWLGLFSLWIYATPVVSKCFFDAHHNGNIDFEQGTKWVGICFALYSILGASLTFALHKILKKKSKYAVHSIALLLGGLGLISFNFVPSKYLLLLSFVLVGIAWSSISTTPYLLVSEIATDGEQEKYFSVFNFSTVIPQAIAAFLFAYITKDFFHGEMIKTILMGGVFMIIAASISWGLHLKFSNIQKPKATNI